VEQSSREISSFKDRFTGWVLGEQSLERLIQ
jgi:hypothetical protein